MRESGGPTAEDFEEALDYAVQGAVVTDTGLSEEVEAALDAIRRIAPDRDPKLVQAARDAFQRQIN